MAETIDAWRAWSDLHQTYRGPWQELVHHSGRVLQALSYQPTGAIIAAATTSLPEVVGGERNWDYRYSWVRDASFTMQALWVAACPDEAHEFFTFMADAGAASLPEQHLQIMFGVGGELDLTERHLPHLRGWRGSAPVRVGNGAWDQPQLDVYGELLDAAFLLRGQLGAPTPATQAFLIALADAAADQWQHPDNGIWEIRGEPRQYLFSKLMCWVALDHHRCHDRRAHRRPGPGAPLPPRIRGRRARRTRGELPAVHVLARPSARAERPPARGPHALPARDRARQ